MYDATVETIPHLCVHPVFRMSTAACTGATAFHGQALFSGFRHELLGQMDEQLGRHRCWPLLLPCKHLGTAGIYPALHGLWHALAAAPHPQFFVTVVLSSPDLQRGELLFSHLGSSLVSPRSPGWFAWAVL